MQYIIVNEKNELFLGPKDWNARQIENCLEEDFEISTKVQIKEPNEKVVVENITIWPINNIATQYNQKTEVLDGPYFDFTKIYKADMYFKVKPKNFEILKSELKEIIASNRYNLEVFGISVKIQNTEVNITTRRIERDIFGQALLLGSDNANWKFGDIWLTLSNDDLKIIVKSIMDHVQKSFNWESSKISEIDNCTTLQELDNVVLEY